MKVSDYADNASRVPRRAAPGTPGGFNAFVRLSKHPAFSTGAMKLAIKVGEKPRFFFKPVVHSGGSAVGA